MMMIYRPPTEGDNHSKYGADRVLRMCRAVCFIDAYIHVVYAVSQTRKFSRSFEIGNLSYGFRLRRYEMLPI